jgi:glycyl-radical enzyme activating protein family
MKPKIIKKGFNYSQDGPGNRLVYHLQGCNMRCKWCANPESIAGQGVIMIDREKLLESVCPYHAIKEQALSRNICHNCQEQPCIYQNKNEGIYLSCFEMDIWEVIEEAKESKTLFFDNGGVTFSGGEPTYQFEVLKEMLIRLKEENISTAIETNGTHERLEELFPYIDTLIMDFKHIDSELHKAYTGLSNEAIKRNVAKAMERHPKVWIRTPLIHGFNAHVKYIEDFIAFYKQFHHKNACFEMLRYHAYGKEKWERCGLVYEMHDGTIEEGLEGIFEEEYKRAGLNVIRT